MLAYNLPRPKTYPCDSPTVELINFHTGRTFRRTDYPHTCVIGHRYTEAECLWHARRNERIAFHAERLYDPAVSAGSLDDFISYFANLAGLWYAAAQTARRDGYVWFYSVATPVGGIS